MTEPEAGTVLERDAAAVRGAVAAARTGLVERELIADLVALCAVAGEHLLVIGEPGTAKSEAVRRVAARLGGSYFEYLLGRFTEPNEVFGPVDLRRLRDGVVEIETAGMLPEADVAFLDEIFLGSTAILNTLLGILNERVFRRGRTAMATPLRVCVGAANTLPDDPALAAFADRFLVRLFVEPVPDARLEELLEEGWHLPGEVRPEAQGGLEEGASGPADGLGTGRLMDAVDRLAAAARRCDVSPVRPLVAAAIRRLRAAGIHLSDRRAVRVQRLVAAAAVLDGRRHASAADLWVLPLIAPTADTQTAAREILADLIEKADNRSLAYAAEEFSRGAQARAGRLAETGRALLDELDDAPLDRDLRLRAEATLREIDAGFAPDDLAEPLKSVRARLAAAVSR
ncbi:MAG: AAA family ATPase [Thermobispora bispora]|nr:AAA family ATPase [Thermobispora bispora]